MNEKANILLVDDRPENLLALEAVLESPGYNLVKANSGEEALMQIIKEEFAVILMDVQMPGMNGFETAKLIKTREKSKHAPIIFITAISQEIEHVHSGYSAGAIDYIFKPFCPKTLLSKVEGFVAIHRYQKQIMYQNDLLNIKTEELEKTNGKLNDLANRLNIIGEIAASIAHEVRNPMTVVRGFLQIAKDKPEKLLPENLELMIEELDRANTIVTEFLSLAKNKKNDYQHKDLNKVVEAIFPLVQAEACRSGKNVALNLGECPMVYLDEKEIRQLILNITLNGLEAIPSGKNVTIRTYDSMQEVILEIKDQGSGISKEILDKIWNPFFTTKEEGTGLGLTVCYNIANRHNAKIDVESGEQGTTFYVRFKL